MSRGSAEDIERWLNSSTNLQRVIPVAVVYRVAAKPPVTVVAVALWEDGVTVYLAQALLGGASTRHARWVLTDDRGTEYALSGGGGGSSGLSRANENYSFTPAPPPQARALYLRRDGDAEGSRLVIDLR